MFGLVFKKLINASVFSAFSSNRGSLFHETHHLDNQGRHAPPTLLDLPFPHLG